MLKCECQTSLEMTGGAITVPTCLLIFPLHRRSNRGATSHDEVPGYHGLVFLELAAVGHIELAACNTGNERWEQPEFIQNTVNSLKCAWLCVVLQLCPDLDYICHHACNKSSTVMIQINISNHMWCLIDFWCSGVIEGISRMYFPIQC